MKAFSEAQYLLSYDFCFYSRESAQLLQSYLYSLGY